MGVDFRHPALTAGDERGQAIVEAALVFPLLVAMMLAVVQFGQAYVNKTSLVHAANVGAAKGAMSRGAPNPALVCVNATKAATSELVASRMTVTCLSTWAAGADVVVTVTYPYSLQLILWHKSGTMTVTAKDVVR